MENREILNQVQDDKLLDERAQRFVVEAAAQLVEPKGEYTREHSNGGTIATRWTA